jgi:hypothetical protein
MALNVAGTRLNQGIAFKAIAAIDVYVNVS